MMKENKQKFFNLKTLIIFLCIAWIGFGIFILVETVDIPKLQANKYDHKWIIGKPRAEIEEKYGEFDQFGDYPFISDEIEKSGYYIISDCRAGFLGEEPGVRYCVHFYKNGMAAYCELEYFGDFGEWWSLDPIEIYEEE